MKVKARSTSFPAPWLPNPWFWRLSAVVVLCLLAGTIAFVVFTLRQDQEEQRATLLSDVLWLEQNLRFEFERNEELLKRLVNDPPRDDASDAALLGRIRQALGAETGLGRLIWFDASRQVRAMQPPGDPRTYGFDEAAIADVLIKARAFGRPVYGGLIEGERGEPAVMVAVAGFEGSRLSGYIVGVYPLAKVLAGEVPWWFSQRYRLSVLDSRGREVAAKSRVAVLQPELSYEVAFDPPGGGLNLRVDAYRTSTRLVPLIFITGMVTLACALLWSLRMLWRHMRRRHHAEQALRRETNFRRVMEDSLHTGLRARDREGRITYVNPAFCRMVGWEAHELIGKGPPMPYWAPTEIECTRELHEKVMKGEASHQALELRLRRRNGELFDALIYEAPLIDENGQHTGWMGSVLDVTERKRAEELARTQQERLQATARLVTVGELASTLAHELNQPLAAVSAYVSGCLSALENDAIERDELIAVLNKIGNQSQRAGNIIHRVQGLVRRSEPRDGMADLVVVAREAAALLDSLARKRRVRIVLAFAHEVPLIRGDAVLVEQVVVNLMRNGIDAMQDTLEAQRQLRVAIAVRPGQVELSVSDTGCGIAPEVAPRLFSPLFTTKPEGMGMGLNICRSIVEWHRGRLSFEANPGGGTIFRITLPRGNPA